jgi:hypothetical protein
MNDIVARSVNRKDFLPRAASGLSLVRSFDPIFGDGEGPPVERNEGRIAPAPPELHGRYTLFRMLCGDSNRRIQNDLAQLLLPCPSGAELSRRRAANRPPRGFSMQQPPFSPSTRTYLFVLRLYDLATGTNETRRALEAMHMPRVRELVESSLLVCVPPAAIAIAVTRLLGFVLNREAITEFAALFFRTEVVTTAQVKIAVEDRVRVGLRMAASSETDPASLARALAGDPRVFATSLPATPASWLPVLNKIFDVRSRAVQQVLAEAGVA